jgi:glycosyltransferase involved in cell wall biosynthesis
MRLALLSGAFPPQFDGIGDHSWWLSQAFADRGHQVTVFTSFPADRPEPPNVQVIPCFDASKSETIPQILSYLKEGGFEWLVVQYNPFCYGRRGFAPGLVSALRSSPVPIACIFHETFAVPLWPWQHIVMRIWQYPQFVLLSRTGQRHFVSTERWLAQVRRWAKGDSYLLPVGSNLPLCTLSKSEARQKLGLSRDALIVGAFGFAHGSKRISWISAAAKTIHARFSQTQVLAIGQVGQQLRQVCGEVPVLDHGLIPGPEVSLRLRAMDLFLAPLSDGISGRRGSVIAAFQHGVPICSTFRADTDKYLRQLVSPAFSLSSGDEKDEFAKAALGMAEASLQHPNLGLDLAAFHDEHFAWPVLADRILKNLSALPDRDGRDR